MYVVCVFDSHGFTRELRRDLSSSKCLCLIVLFFGSQGGIFTDQLGELLDIS